MLDRRIEFNAVERFQFEIPMRYHDRLVCRVAHDDSLVNSVDDESRAGFLDDMERSSFTALRRRRRAAPRARASSPEGLEN